MTLDRGAGLPDDPVLASLLTAPQDEDERALAARYAPVLLFDAREPFLPLAAGYTLFRQSSPSPSFRQGFRVNLAPQGQPPARLAIEYAIWWDWDIGHLYELEHVWIYVDDGGRVVRCEASWHGGYHDMRHAGHLALEGDHAMVYSEPGKHAFAPTPDWFKERRKEFKRSETSELAGISGVLMARYIEGKVKPTPHKTRLVHTYLARQAFEPGWEFSQVFRFTPDRLVPWPALCGWMPVRVNHILDRLAGEIAPAGYRVLRIGHRGAAAHAPDNTLLGIRTAATLGADLVEMDVRLTADGQVVLSHPEYHTDANGHIHFVGQSTSAELQTIDLGQGEHIPTLAQAIELCKQEQLGAYVELKDGRCVPAVVSLVREMDFGSHCIIASFRPDWVAEAKAIAPRLLASVLFSSTHIDPVPLAQSARANFVHPCWEQFEHPTSLLTPEWVARVREADLGIICWHEERLDEIATLRRAGVDGICSDTPEWLR